MKTKALHLEKHHDISRSKVQKLQGRYTHLEEENSALQMENFELVSELEDKQHEIECQQKDHDTTSTQLPKFLSSKIGNRYSSEIRMLYYSLFENEVPAVEIETVVKSVIKCFHQSVSIDELSLPKKYCASYMRLEELKTISDIHKATVLSYISNKKVGLKLNTDGTTKNRKS